MVVKKVKLKSNNFLSYSVQDMIYIQYDKYMPMFVLLQNNKFL